MCCCEGSRCRVVDAIEADTGHIAETQFCIDTVKKYCKQTQFTGSDTDIFQFGYDIVGFLFVKLQMLI